MGYAKVDNNYEFVTTKFVGLTIVAKPETYKKGHQNWRKKGKKRASNKIKKGQSKGQGKFVTKNKKYVNMWL